MLIRKMDREAVREYIRAQSKETKVYIGSDSERFKINGQWVADYTTVVVVHRNGNNGCRIFGEINRLPVYDMKKDRPKMRLMQEVYFTSAIYLELADVLDDRRTEIHLDINPKEEFGSSCALKEAVGHIRGTCGINPMVKPDAWAASFAADRLKEVWQFMDDARKAA